LSVTKHKLKFEELIFECGFQINHLPTTYMFYNGLKLEFKRKMILHVVNFIEKCFFWL